MPPWVVSVPRSHLRCTSRAVHRLLTTSRYQYALASRLPHHCFSKLHIRCASTIVSPTAINARPNIRLQNKELYDALNELKKVAKDLVNVSRVQLAVQGVAVERPVIRVAVLGLNNQGSARRVARLLLADPLGVEEAWETDLDAPGRKDGAVLLQYGNSADTQNDTSLYRVLTVPSRILRSHNLEVLVSVLNTNTSDTNHDERAQNSRGLLLEPKILSASATDGLVSYPVHKTLVVGEGLESAFTLGRFLSGTAITDHDLVKIAIDIPVSTSTGVEPQETRKGSVTLNIQTGIDALAIFRKSVENSLEYERGWFKSGMPDLTTWLVKETEPSEPVLPIVRKLIVTVLSDIESELEILSTSRLHDETVSPSDQQMTTSLNFHIDLWAEKSHAELRDQLDDAFSARAWHKLSWWKLFWRVDDVTVILSDILERKWLVSVERNAMYLAGQLYQAGYPNELDQVIAKPLPDAPPEATVPPPIKASTSLSTCLLPSTPWPTLIPNARTTLSATIPPLQALAQRLILQTLSTTSLSTALSALLYVIFPSTSLFEASAIAALGLTFSLRRMQKIWESAREEWTGSVREEGRACLKDAESVMRGIVGRHQRVEGVEGEDEARRRDVQDAVGRVRIALKRLERSGGKSV